MHSNCSNVEVYVNNQQKINSNGHYAHKSYVSDIFKGATSEYKCVLHTEFWDLQENPDDIQDSLLSDHSFSRRMTMLVRGDGFTIHGKLGVDFFKNSEILYPNMKVRTRLIRARPNFYKISDNPNIVLGIVDCSLYTRQFGLKEDYYKRRMNMLAYTPVEYNYVETLAKHLSFHPVKVNSSKKIFSTMLLFVASQ